jgi:hypothetical protein
MRRSSLFLLTTSCATGLLLATSYLGESPTQASAENSGSVEGRVERLVEARQTMSAALVERGHEIAYALERTKDAVGDLIP